MADSGNKSILTRWWLWVIIIFAVVLIVGRQDGGQNNSQQAAQPQKQSVSEISMPSDQRAFLRVVTSAQRGSAGADNDMQRGGMLSERNKAICAAVSELTISDWTGQIETIGANSEGKGVLGIRLADDVIVKTWNNAFSDIAAKTLMEPGTPLFRAASSFQKDDLVKFSGQFISDRQHCVRESSMTLQGNLRKPEFIVRFESISKI